MVILGFYFAGAMRLDFGVAVDLFGGSCVFAEFAFCGGLGYVLCIVDFADFGWFELWLVC